MRANLLDELHKPYVVTARAKGASGAPADPEVPGAGGAQPLRQHGRLDAARAGLGRDHRRRRAEPADDRSAAAAARSSPRTCIWPGAIILLLSILTVVGTLISDILLAWLDPRIRFS